jgi:N-acetylglucosamine-6-phosphate deacetylase
VKIRDGVARGPDGQLAGSVLTMIEAVRNLHALDVPLPQALEAASTVPASVLGLPDVGRLEPGASADIVVVDDNLRIERVLVGGQERVVA